MEKYNHEEEFKDSPDIEVLEAKVAEIDAEILRLAQRRAMVAQMMAEVRLAKGEPANPHSELLQQEEKGRNIYMGRAIIRILQRIGQRRA